MAPTDPADEAVERLRALCTTGDPTRFDRRAA
jgi:hypothetical protein